MFQRSATNPFVTMDTLINRGEESRDAATEKIGKFLKGAGLSLNEKNIEKYFKYYLREPVSKRTVSEILYRLKEDKWLEPEIEKRGEKALKIITGRKRIIGKNK